MSNHYHLRIETPDANLSKGMRRLNGFCTQNINRRHGRVGHLFQGRYKGILVEKGKYSSNPPLQPYPKNSTGHRKSNPV
jgi:putative transposase